MEREEEDEMLREKQSLRRWRAAQSPAHPSGGTSLRIRRLSHSGGCGSAGVPMDHTDPCEGGVPRGQRDWELPEGNQSSGSSGIPAWVVSPSLGGTEVLCGVTEVALCTKHKGLCGHCGSSSFIGVSAHQHGYGTPQSGTTANSPAPTERPGLGERKEERSKKERSGAELGQNALPVLGALSGTLLGAAHLCERTRFWGISHLATSLLAAPPGTRG